MTRYCQGHDSGCDAGDGGGGKSHKEQGGSTTSMFVQHVRTRAHITEPLAELGTFGIF